jgi:3-keto-disaccharide hydrolase
MKPVSAVAGALLLATAATLPASRDALAQGAQGWTSLIDGKSLDAHWNKIGEANWKIEDGAAVATKGAGYLVSKQLYGDFQLKAEFWADEDTNSGIFIRCSDPEKIGGDTCYEVNIYDKRPEPAYGTGAIVNVAKVEPMPKAAGKWNTYEITAQGPHLVVVLNGVKTVDAQDSKHAKGVIALQEGANADKKEGAIKFRKVEIKPL